MSDSGKWHARDPGRPVSPKIERMKAGISCLLPAFTFAGTVSAVVGAGLIPMFVDVDSKTCVIDLDRLQDEDLLRRTAAVVTVASFGHLPDLARCSAFEARTGIPIIVDAAGCSDAPSLRCGKVAGRRDACAQLPRDESIRHR